MLLYLSTIEFIFPIIVFYKVDFIYLNLKDIYNVTKTVYSANVSENLDGLVGRYKTFFYKPQAIKRVDIPKLGNNKLIQLGIPAYQDKLVQGVMTYILTIIYETKFEDFSYGFCPRRGCHDVVKVTLLHQFVLHNELLVS